MKRCWRSVLIAYLVITSCTSYSPPVVTESSHADQGETGLIIKHTPQLGCGLWKILLSTANFYFYIDDQLVGRSNFCRTTRQFVSLEAGDYRLRIDNTEISPATLWSEVLNEENKAKFNLDAGQRGILEVSATTERKWVGGQEEYSTKAQYRLGNVNNAVWE